MSKSAQICLLVGLTSTLIGCSLIERRPGATQINQPLPDDVTSEVVVNLREPVVFFRAAPALSSVARDYLYIGPVQTDNSGVRELSLWVGLASTIDRDYVREAQPVGDELVLQLDANSQASSTLRLPLIPWIHHSDESPFTTAMPLALALRAPITHAQIEAVVAAKSITIDLNGATQEPMRYQHWRGQWLAWQEIDEDTQVGFAVRVQQSQPQTP